MTQPLNQNKSRLDEEPVFSQIKEAISKGETNASIALAYNASEKSIRRFRHRHSINPASFDPAFTEIKGDEAEAVTAPSVILEDPDTMLRQRGLNPEEWIIDGLRANEYQGPASAAHAEKTGENKVTYYQTRFNVVRKVSASTIMAPRTDGWIAPPKTKLSTAQGELVVIVGDQQAPFHDKVLHQLFCNWLRVNKPHRGVSLGDGFDFPDIRPGHRVYPEHNATVNECLQSGYNIFRDYTESSLNTFWQKLMGNHDERIRNILLDTANTRTLYGIKRPDTRDQKGEDLHGLAHAARLNELGIEVIDTGGSYEQGQVNLSKYLAVRHGWLARKGSGSSALASLEALRYSVIVGHTHRQSIVYDTTANIDGEINTLTAAEAGCMCRVSQTPDLVDGRIWPGYAVHPNWQQGFMTATIWDDGKFHLDPAIYVDGTLMWRDQRYEV